jgi:hypothetical protein
MPRPKTKTALLELSQQNFKALNDYIDQLDPAAQEANFNKKGLNRNIRDVLAHLHHWHIMMLTWYDVGMKGKKPMMPAKDYTWKTVPLLNKWINEHYQNKSLKEVRLLLVESFQSLQEIIHQHTEKELFEKKYYKWTGTTSLGSYLISATSSHYEWGLKLINKARK